MQHVIGFLPFSSSTCALALLALPYWDNRLLETMSVTALKLAFERIGPTVRYKRLRRHPALPDLSLLIKAISVLLC